MMRFNIKSSFRLFYFTLKFLHSTFNFMFHVWPCPHDRFPNRSRSIVNSSRPLARVHMGETGIETTSRYGTIVRGRSTTLPLNFENTKHDCTQEKKPEYEMTSTNYDRPAAVQTDIGA